MTSIITKPIPFFPFRNKVPTRSNTSGLCSQLLPWPLSRSFPLFQLPPVPLSSSSFLVFHFYLSLCIPIHNLPFYGRGILRQCKTNSLPFPQFDFRCHSFLLYTPPQFFVWNNARSKNLKSFTKALVYRRLQVICYSWCHLPCFLPI